MKKVYIAPSFQSIEIEAGAMLANSVSVNVYNHSTGGDDGSGGYDPSGSLSNERGMSNNNWDSAW